MGALGTVHWAVNLYKVDIMRKTTFSGLEYNIFWFASRWETSITAKLFKGLMKINNGDETLKVYVIFENLQRKLDTVLLLRYVKNFFTYFLKGKHCLWSPVLHSDISFVLKTSRTIHVMLLIHFLSFFPLISFLCPSLPFSPISRKKSQKRLQPRGKFQKITQKKWKRITARMKWHFSFYH